MKVVFLLLSGQVFRPRGGGGAVLDQYLGIGEPLMV